MSIANAKYFHEPRQAPEVGAGTTANCLGEWGGAGNSAGGYVLASLGLVVGDGEPLHIAAIVSATGTERRGVVDLVARAGQAGPAGDRAGVRLDEGVTLDGAAGLLGVRLKSKASRQNCYKQIGLPAA